MRGYFHTDSDMVLSQLAEAITRADLNGQSFRISVENGVMKYKVGEGMWSPPIYSTPDPHRDAPVDLSNRPSITDNFGNTRYLGSRTDSLDA